MAEYQGYAPAQNYYSNDPFSLVSGLFSNDDTSRKWSASRICRKTEMTKPDLTLYTALADTRSITTSQDLFGC